MPCFVLLRARSAEAAKSQPKNKRNRDQQQRNRNSAFHLSAPVQTRYAPPIRSANNQWKGTPVLCSSEQILAPERQLSLVPLPEQRPGKECSPSPIRRP